MKKTTATLTSTLGLVLGSLHAQTVPPYINYQGKVTDGSGVGLGTGTPVNRKMIFRIFDAPTGGNRLWSEQHTVTISNGEFSVLLGNGIDAVYNSITETPTKTNTPLDTVFTSTGVQRFVEIVVDNADQVLNTSDVPITPRQQITSTAYSFRARSADTIATGTDLQLNGSADYGLGYYGSTRPFNGVSVNGPVLFGQAGGALGSVNGGTKNIALRWNATGNVGIGSADLSNASAGTKLVLQNDDTNSAPLQLSIRGNTDTNKRLLLGYNTSGNYGSLQAYSAASTTTKLLLNPDGGNVGIGTTDASNKLSVNGNVGINGDINAGRIAASGTGGFSFNSGDNDGGIFSPGDGTIVIRTDNTEKVRVTPGGLFGIGTSSPSTTLDVRSSSPAITVGNSNGLSGALYFGNSSHGVKRAYNADNDVGLFTTGGDIYLSAQGNTATTGLVLKSGGNVGIGTNSPGEKLTVSGTFRATGAASMTNVDANSFRVDSSRSTYTGGSYLEWNKIVGEGRTFLLNHKGLGYGGIVFGFVADNGNVTEHMRVDHNGRVGIGNNGPSAPLHVSGSVTSTFLLAAFMDQDTVSANPNSNSTQPHSIIADSRMRASAYDVLSDNRIKNIIGLSDSSKDLETLMKIDVTDYQFKDAVSNGNKPQKKVIAQQVEKVFPQAVGLSTNVIPDIFKKASAKDGWIELATDLKVGDRVKLIANEHNEVHEVLEVASGRFRTSFKNETKELFVYGREVSDFRSVDYEAISMLNVSATQEMKKASDAELKKLRDENAELRAKVVSLENREKAMDTRISQIEKLLSEPVKASSATVSIRKDAAAE